MSAVAHASRLDIIPPEPISAPSSVAPRGRAIRGKTSDGRGAEPVNSGAHRGARVVSFTAPTQEQYDALAAEQLRLRRELDDTKVRLATLEAMIRAPRSMSDPAAPHAFVLPRTENAPARRVFDSSAFMAEIAERPR